MAISIDWGTKVISVPQSYLTLISGTLYNLDTNQFRLDLRALEATDPGMAYPKTHNHNTTVSLSGIEYARVVEIINGYTVEFENGAYAVNLDGSNNNILDVAVRNNVSVGANNSAGLIGLSNLEAAAYNGKITVDIISGESGTAFPIGTLNRPVNNLIDANTLADRYGLPEISFRTSTTIDSGDWSDGHIFTSTSPVLVTLTVTSGANVAGCEFRDSTVTGVLSTSTVVRTCYAYDISIGGFMFNTAIGGTITMLGPLSLLDCWSGIPGLSHPEIIINDTGDLGVRAYTGGIGINNMAAATTDVSVDILGSAHLHPSMTDGICVVRGTGILNDNSAGTTVVNTGFVEGEKIRETHKALGLDAADPVTVTPTGLDSNSGDIDVNFTGDGVSTTTMTRQP